MSYLSANADPGRFAIGMGWDESTFRVDCASFGIHEAFYDRWIRICTNPRPYGWTQKITSVRAGIGASLSPR